MRKGNPRSPEERRLFRSLRVTLRGHRKRHKMLSGGQPPLLPTGAVHDEGSCGKRGVAALAARRGRFSSAVAYLRNLWLIDGRHQPRDSSGTIVIEGTSSREPMTTSARHRRVLSSSDSGPPQLRRQRREASWHGGASCGGWKHTAAPDSPHAPSSSPPPAFLPAPVVNAIR